MCGELSDMPVDIDEESVTTDISGTVGTGFGAITFSCADDSDVVSGLNGQSEIGCDAATGEFDVGTASDGAHVKCGATVCGDPEDVVEIGAGASYTCDGNSCTFACSEEDVSPSLPQLICNSQTSKFVTGPIKRVSCNANCAPFGPDSGFRLDTKLKKFCKQQANGLEQCDLICRNRAKPTVEQTKQEVKRIRCHQNDRTGEAKWMALVNNAFGIPSLTPILQAVNATEMAIRDVVCDKAVKPTPPKPKRCPDVGDTYKISTNVKVRCQWELCSFKCPKGQQLNVPSTHVFCLPDKTSGSPFWYPTIDNQIKCVDKNEDDDETKPTKCSAFPNEVEKDVTKSCSDNKCNFTCEDGKPNVKAATCSNGKWNVNDKVMIVCEGKTNTTPATVAPTTAEPHCDKKCQKKKKKEQKKKDKENNNNDGDECDKKCQKQKKKEQKQQDKENKKKDKENNKKDKGNKDKEDGKKKKNKKGKELEDYESIGDYADYVDATTTTDEPTTTQVFTTAASPTEKPKKKKNKKNLDNIDEIGELDGAQAASAGYSPYALAADGQSEQTDRCDPADLSNQYGNGLDIDCDFGFKGWYICKISCASGRPDTEVVSCDTGSKSWDTSNVKCN